jgi:hypothetical protein
MARLSLEVSLRIENLGDMGYLHADTVSVLSPNETDPLIVPKRSREVDNEARRVWEGIRARAAEERGGQT